MECPKCQSKHAAGDTECQKCGIIFAKYRQRQARDDHFVQQKRPLLDKCQACGCEVAISAFSCPHCGDPRRKTAEQEKVETDTKIKGWSTLIVLLCVGYIFLNSCGPEEEKKAPPPNPAVEARLKDEEWKYFAQEEITKRMKDPESVQFRDVFVSRKSGAPLVCGLINGKNGFGGYSGFQRFISGGKVLNILETDMATGEMDKSWQEFCGQ